MPEFLILGRVFAELIAPGYLHLFSFDRLLYVEKTRYQLLEIYEHKLFGKVLVLDGKPQLSTWDEHVYHEILVHPAMLAHPNPRRVAVLGGGDGGAVREVLKHPSVEEAYLVDVDERVVEACRRYLAEVSQGVFEDPRVKLVHRDGFKFIEEWSGEPFDVVVVDLTDPISLISIGLYTKEFFELLSSKLSAEGVVSVQSESPSFSKYNFPVNFQSIVATVGSVFEYTVAAREFIPCFGCDWGFTFASHSDRISSLTGREVDRELERRGVSTRYLSGDTFESVTRLPGELRREVEEAGVVTSRLADRYVEEYRRRCMDVYRRIASLASGC